MSELINLNRARKNRARIEKKQAADENAVKHGLSKAERVLQASKVQKAAHMLDQHQLDDDN